MAPWIRVRNSSGTGDSVEEIVDLGLAWRFILRRQGNRHSIDVSFSSSSVTVREYDHPEAYQQVMAYLNALLDDPQ
jgi:hypothetical protein